MCVLQGRQSIYLSSDEPIKNLKTFLKMQIFEGKWQTQVTLEITGQPFFTQMTDVPSKCRSPGLDSGRSVNRKRDSQLPYSTRRTTCLLFSPSFTLFICPSCLQFQALSSVSYFISQLHISPFFFLQINKNNNHKWIMCELLHQEECSNKQPF